MHSTQPPYVTMYSIHPPYVTMYSTQPPYVTMYSTQPPYVTMYSTQPPYVTMYSAKPPFETMYSVQAPCATINSTQPPYVTMDSTRLPFVTIHLTQSPCNDVLNSAPSSSSVIPTVSLGFTILGGIFAYVTVFLLSLTIEVVTFRFRGWCVLGVFLLPVFTRLEHECHDLLSPYDGIHTRTDWTSVYTLIQKSFL